MKHQVPEDEKVSGFLTSEIGNIIRIYVSVCHMRWMKVEADDKRKLQEALLVLFELDLSHPKICEYVDKKMGKLYSVFKWWLHQHYLACGTPEKGRFTLPPSDLWNNKPESHWHWLCDKVYTTEDFLELSKKNSENRKQQWYHHKGGVKPFIQHARKAHKKGAPLSVLDNWARLHKDKNGQWINDIAREKYDEMNKMRDQIIKKMIEEAPNGTPHDSIKVPLDVEIKIMSEKLKRRGRFIHCVGVFPRMQTSSSPTTSSMVSSSELNGIQDHLNVLSNQVVELQKENKYLKAQLTLQKENDDLRAQLQAVLATHQGQQ